MLKWQPTKAGKQVCSTCKIEKPVEAYAIQKAKRSGIFAECKQCQRVRNQKWIDSNRDRFRHMNKDATNLKRRRDPVRAMIQVARARCRKKGMEFSITEADVFIPEFCPVLGIPLTAGLGFGCGHGLAIRDTRASLDRIDNSKGYISGNVVVVSYRANRIKSDANVSELLKIARFYAKLDAHEGGEAALPALQPYSEKQTRPLHECVEGGRRSAVPLS